MPTDNFGRQVDPVSQTDLASGMLSSTQNMSKQVNEALIQIVANIKSQNIESRKLVDKVNSLLKQNSSLYAKIETFSKNVVKGIDESRKLNEKIKSASKSRNQQPLSEQSLKRTLKDHSLKNTDSFKQIQAIKKILYSKNTVWVEVKGFKKSSSNLLKALRAFHSDLSDSLKTVSRREKKRNQTVEGLMVAEETGTLEGIPRKEGLGIPSEEGMKRATKESKTFASNEQIAAKFAHHILHDQRLSSKLLGETNIEHKEYLKRLEKADAFGLKSGKINKHLVEIEAKRMDLASQYSKGQQKQLKHLKERVRLTQEGSEEEKKAIQDVFNFIEQTNKKIERNIERDIKQTTSHIHIASKEIEKVKNKLSEVASFLQITPIVNRWDELTHDVVKSQQDYVQQIRQTAFQQGQVTHVLEEQEALDEARIRTGQSLAKLQKEYTKNLRKGLKDDKVAIKLAERGLGLASLIGADAERTSDTVREWNMRFGLSIDKVSTLSREMKNVARQTGVVGEDLLNATKASEKAMMNMRNLGTLTADVAAQLIKLNASAGKFGVGEELQQITSALTGGIDNFMRLEPQMKNLLLKAGRLAGVSQRSILFGTVDENDIKKMFSGIGTIYEQKLRSMGAKSIEDLSKSQLQNLQVWAKQFNLNIGQLELLNKAQKEANKSYTDRLKELQDQKRKYDDGTLTKIEKANLEMQISGLKFGEAARLLGKSKQGFKNETEALKGLGVKATTQPTIEKELVKTMYEAIQEQRKEAIAAGAREINIGNIDDKIFQQALAGDKNAIKSFTEQANDTDQRIAIAMRNLQDPMTKVENKLGEINDFLKETFGGFAAEWHEFLTTAGVLIGGLSLGAKALSGGKRAIDLIKGLRGIGGGGGGVGFGGKSIESRKRHS